MTTASTTSTTTGATTGTSNPLGAGVASDPNVGRLTGREETLANWVGPYVTNMLGRAEALSNLPYQTYGGPLTAGASSLQQQYFTGLGNLGFPSTLGKSFTDTGVMQSYMNPYMQQVLQPQMQAMQRQADIQRSTMGANLAKSGAFGGARSGLMGQQLNAELMRQQQQTTGKAYQDAFTQGLGQFNTEQQNAKDLAGMMASAGATQRGIEQEGITADYNEFLQQRDYPMKQVQFLQSMLQGLPVSAVSNQYQQPSNVSQFLGGAGGILGLLQQMGVIPKN